ncbi:MAG: AAA family ATPase, partial [Syntrophales bacterium LBB04]|nr:AAA family ATPase [Syntrophales bacterium LBB04]
MQCVRCGWQNPAEMNFCGKCGYGLGARSDVSTRSDVTEEKSARNQRYLPEGSTAGIPSQKDRNEGERRQVTIMFCDMKGFTPLTQKLGAEETFVLMKRILNLMVVKVHQYDGAVNEIMGDGILAIFGAPDALEDGPQRAIRASIAIHKEIAEFNEKIAHDEDRIPPIQLRIGINTGTVVVGNVEIDLKVQFTLVGNTINMASRTQALAEPGSTYVTEETYRLTKDLFHFEPVGRKMVKSNEGPITVYKVIAAKEDVFRPRLGSERTIYAEMIGRDAELNKLELQVMKAINGQGSIVNIIGEAGLGKSRLVTELNERDVMRKVTFLEGRAISTGKNLSFHPIIDLAKQWVGIREHDGEIRAFDKLEAAIRRLLLSSHLTTPIERHLQPTH